MRCHLPCVLGVLLLTSASAGELSVRLDDGHGNPAANAVVTLRREGDNGTIQRTAAMKIIDQRDETFIPYVEIFRPGDQVVFRNSDRTRHHVYSFAPAKAFEFVIAPGVHHLIVRTNGGPWAPPPGVPVMQDSFGGTVGSLVVP